MILCGKITSDSGRAIDSNDRRSALTPRNASTIAAITITAPAKQYAQNNAGRDPEPIIAPKIVGAIAPPKVPQA
jgi:hypothetical protein